MSDDEGSVVRVSVPFISHLFVQNLWPLCRSQDGFHRTEAAPSEAVRTAC